MSYNWNQQGYQGQEQNNDSNDNKTSTNQNLNGSEEKHAQVILPSLLNLNNNTVTSPDSSVPAPSMSTSAAVSSTHDQMSTNSIMNPTTASMIPSVTNGSTSASNQESTTQNVKSEKHSTGFSVASFDNPLPPKDDISQAQPTPSASTTTPDVPTGSELAGTQPVDGTVAAGQTQEQQDATYRPLNVKDALSYLEQVKFQFSSRPDIYNHFLDIMKDFKSQAIDTPGVIERVSTLFKGYPTLIQGFNTFLPQGYRIDCSDNPDDPIRVTTPMGSSTLQEVTSSVAVVPVPEQTVEAANVNISSTPTYQGHQQAQQPLLSSAVQQAALQQPHVPPPISQYSQLSSGIHNQLPPSSNILNQLTAREQTNKKPADVEFSQAINYVNKIKNRFADQPDIYKNFLEILQTYQREQKPINEVYAQVTVLFQNAPDLLDDFKKFLPDSPAAEQQQAQQQAQQPQIPHIQQPQQRANYMYNGINSYYSPTAPPGIQVTQQQNLPPIGSFSPPNNGVPFHEDYNDQNRPQTMGLPSMIQHEQAMDMAHVQQQQANNMQNISNENIPISNLRSSGMMDHYAGNELLPPHQRPQPGMGQPMPEEQYGEVPVRPEIDSDPSIVPVVPEPTEPIENNLTLVEETSFFDRVKKYIGNKQVYTEFLKILNLFSQDLLDVNELTSKVEYYIGSNKELFDWFKNFVGFRDQPKIIENIVHEKHRLNLDLCEACGPSYKKLPKSDTFMPCSGRDDMCWEVLNDEWVGHPVWASEDSGFIAHRKNQYEETLFKTEEERHEYDFYIESNLRTIQTLETIANKISNMSEEEKKLFKLPPGLGHNSLTIYKKVIRKVYDKERGFEIIDALHEHPAIAVPVILKRLKQKDEEWRRAQREWNKVWRELEQKVYFKSLDHLGLTFKQADKKLLTTKQLISEISSIKVDQTNKRIHWLTPKPKSQLDFDIKDFDIIFDILQLSFVFIDRVSNYSNPDKARLRDFLKVFIGIFFSIPIEKIDEALKKRGISLEEGKLEDSKDAEGETDSKKRMRSTDLQLTLGDILHRTKYQKLKNANNEDPSKAGVDEISPDDEEKLEEEAESIKQDATKPWLLGDIVDKANADGIISNRVKFNLFGNTNVYVFIRHLTTLYDRLLEVKALNEIVTKEVNNRKTVQFAKDLCLVSTQLKDMGLDFVGEDSYQEILRLGERLILGDIEHQWFEESLRQAYNNKAFKLYTIDKVIQSIVKHAHTLMTDNKTSEIIKLFEKDRTLTSTSTKNQILYRLQTRSHMSTTENMFRIQYAQTSKHICIQYIALDDLTLKDSKTENAKWKYYITSYSLPHPTEGIDESELKMPFLERILEFEQNEFEETNQDEDDSESVQKDKYAPEGISNSALKIVITPVTYALDIEDGSIDIFSRKSVNKYPEESMEKKFADKKNLVNKFLDSKHGWKKSVTEEEATKVEDYLNGKTESVNTKEETTTEKEVIPEVETKEATIDTTNVQSENNEKENQADEVPAEKRTEQGITLESTGPTVGNSNI